MPDGDPVNSSCNYGGGGGHLSSQEFAVKIIFIFQILFLSGLAFVIGLERTFRFFFQWHKAKGSAAFFGGIAVVLFGWPIIGMCVEVYGFVVLFR